MLATFVTSTGLKASPAPQHFQGHAVCLGGRLGIELDFLIMLKSGGRVKHCRVAGNKDTGPLCQTTSMQHLNNEAS